MGLQSAPSISGGGFWFPHKQEVIYDELRVLDPEIDLRSEHEAKRRMVEAQAENHRALEDYLNGGIKASLGGAQWKMNTPQVIPSTATENYPTDFTTISWDTAVFDHIGAIDLAHPSRLTAQRSGLATFYVNIPWVALTGQSYVIVQINGSAVAFGESVNATGGAGPIDTTQLPSTILQVNAGDYFEVLLSQNSGGGKQVGGTVLKALFSMVYFTS